ncbi:cytochrome P450 [Pseudohongiella sp. SYSU M77423]|uniref:cytochrome P450 n=1 Tax=Pseudohongiella sp. SYSU M77423 TaxID=3042312 RepID=UPI002480FB6B|nr:cytochrome P450 [Pseudohongiella sp. SYSU M77423]MDH7943783.1 cytochrome P450 [Pseudohongiella sp. SYSU M77423]
MTTATRPNTERQNRSLVGRDPWSIPLDEIDLAHPGIWQANEFLPFMARMRRDAPVHYCPNSAVGPYWSVMKYQDIMTVEAAPHIYSSEPTIGIVDVLPEYSLPMFIAMDPPKHDEQRKTVQGVVAPANLKNLEGLIRQRVGAILDSLPVGETFNWVDLVSRELTTQMLATLFDFPFEERHKLPYWSDVATAIPGAGVVDSYEESLQILQECLARFSELWRERAAKPPGNDLISMLAHGESTRNMPPREFLGNLILLIVGGNDTTRNSITGGVLALNENPDQYQKLRENPALIPSMVSEIIRWQTPLAYMRRTAKCDTELNGQKIRQGDKVLLWYASGNRDGDAIENPDSFIIDRPRARQHLSFGFGIHRCMGNRLAEMQLRILWEEILKRFHTVEVTGEPTRIYSSFVKGYTELPVRLHPL